MIQKYCYSIILYSGTAVDLLIILMLFLPKEKAEKTSLTSIFRTISRLC